jgi:hypothetical protein
MKTLLVFLICCAPAMCQGTQQAAPDTVKPTVRTRVQAFTVVKTSVYTLPDGTFDPKMPIEKMKQLDARSSSGKTVEAETVADFLSQPGFHWRHISDANTGQEITVVDPLRTRETLQKDKPNVRGSELSKRALMHCQIGGLKFLGYETLFGVPLAHLIGENRNEIHEAWAWEEADCYMPQERHTWKNEDGTIRSTTFQRLDSLTVGEPDQKLFEVPSSYIEKSMQRVEREYDMKKFGSLKKAPACIQARFARADWDIVYQTYGVGRKKPHKAAKQQQAD